MKRTESPPPKTAGASAGRPDPFPILARWALLLMISRRWAWWEAWIDGAIAVLGFGFSRLLAARRHPDLLAERATFMRHKDIKAWVVLAWRIKAVSL